ncbi:hypothetical protein VTI74DRAFT_7080 [Chaetomium olivicolor]
MVVLWIDVARSTDACMIQVPDPPKTRAPLLRRPVTVCGEMQRAARVGTVGGQRRLLAVAKVPPGRVRYSWEESMGVVSSSPNLAEASRFCKAAMARQGEGRWIRPAVHAFGIFLHNPVVGVSSRRRVRRHRLQVKRLALFPSEGDNSMSDRPCAS